MDIHPDMTCRICNGPVLSDEPFVVWRHYRSHFWCSYDNVWDSDQEIDALIEALHANVRPD